MPFEVKNTIAVLSNPSAREISNLISGYPEVNSVELQTVSDGDVDSFVSLIADGYPDLLNIQFTGSRVSDRGALALATHCNRLLGVWAQNSRMTDAGICALAQSCPLTVVWLAYSKGITNYGARELGERCSRSLEQVEMVNSGVTDEALSCFGNCELLTFADFRENTRVPATADAHARALVLACPKLANIGLGFRPNQELREVLEREGFIDVGSGFFISDQRSVGA